MDEKNDFLKTTQFGTLCEQRYTRRSFFSRSLFIGLTTLFGRSRADHENILSPNKFEFKGVPTNSTDTVSLPDGFKFKTLISWGDPLWSGVPPFNQHTRGDSYSQKRSFGDNNDGMECFQIDRNRCVLAVNNEYTNSHIIHGNRRTQKAENYDDFQKAKYAHGISIFEIVKKEKDWKLVIDSNLNRRITTDTPMLVQGKLANDNRLNFTKMTLGNFVLGTISNCGSGKTPWGTFLTCEEGFNGYFSSENDDLNLNSETKRYGFTAKGYGYNWHRFEDRFDLKQKNNDMNNFGYVVEIDPLSPNSTPIKRTSLGRFKHENAELVLSEDGKVVVYMGDDGHGEFLYKFVSAEIYRVGENPSALLNDGVLYVAKFNPNGTGKWVTLTPASTGMKSFNDICLYTRLAGSSAGGTTMDRPEWIAADPNSTHVYCSLTNNKYRKISQTNGPNPRAKNQYGQIVMWRPSDDDHASSDFFWDMFLLAGNPLIHDGELAGSNKITLENMFACPDGLRFDRQGNMWIQTDGNYSNRSEFRGIGNNQMLAANTTSGQITRFMVGPRECEITGLTWSPDQETMFVGIQHPGRDGTGHFPDGEGKIPRSSIIAIQKISTYK